MIVGNRYVETVSHREVTVSPSGREPDAGDPDSLVIGQAVLRPRKQVEEHVKNAILTGKVKSGDRLPSEAELARQFAVSRTTVREALRSLSAQGLIRKVPGASGGSFVLSVDHHSFGTEMAKSIRNLLVLGNIDVEEIVAVRQFLEVPSVRLAATRRTKEQLERLRTIVETQKTISVDDTRVPSLDKTFHGTIAEASGNRVLASLITAVHHESEPVRYLDLSPEVGRTTVQQHQAILRAIAEQDPDAGETAIIEHLTYLSEHMLAKRRS